MDEKRKHQSWEVEQLKFVTELTALFNSKNVKKFSNL
jgi:hypothetical protein